MVREIYDISIKEKKLEESYKDFNKEYSKNLRISMTSIKNENFQIYDINDVAVILNETQDKKANRYFGR